MRHLFIQPANMLRFCGALSAGLLLSIGSLAADFDELIEDERLLAQTSEQPAEDKTADGKSPEEKAVEEKAEEAVDEALKIVEDAAKEVMEEAEAALEKEAQADADVIGDGRRFEQSFLSGKGGGDQGYEILSTRVQGVDLHGSAKMRAELERIAGELDPGLQLIEAELDGPGLVERPQFWLLDNDTELVAAIQKQQPEITSERLLMAAKARAYIYKQNSFFVYKAGVGRARLLRLLYEEYALQHLNMLATGGEEQRVAWFHSGFATYMAWITEAELTRRGRDDVFAGMLRTYGPNFDPDKAPALKTLESPGSWAQAIRSDYRGTYAQAALSFQYFVQRFTLSAGPQLLRSMSTGENFEQAFENATRVSLGRFELELREAVYPPVRKLREAAAAAAEAEAKAKAELEKAQAEAKTKAEAVSAGETKEAAPAEAKAESEAKPDAAPPAAEDAAEDADAS